MIPLNVLAATLLVQVSLSAESGTTVAPNPTGTPSDTAGVTFSPAIRLHDGAAGQTEVMALLASGQDVRIDGVMDEVAWAEAFAADRYDGLFVSTEKGLVPFTPGQSRFQGLHSMSVRNWINAWERVRGSFGASWRQTPVFDRGAPTDVAKSLGVDAGLTLYPSGALSVEVGGRHVRLIRERDGSRYSTATIPATGPVSVQPFPVRERRW